MRILVDLSSAQPQGTVKVNGGGEYSVVVFKELFFSLGEKDELEVVLNAQLGENVNLNSFIDENSIKVYKYESIDHFSKIISDNNFNQLFLPICYHKYGQLKVDNSVRVISAIHDLCDIYFYGLLNVKYGKYPKLDNLNFLRRFRDSMKSKKRFDNCIEQHNKVLRLNDNQYIYTVTHYTKSTFSYFLDVENLDDVHVFYPPENHSESYDEYCDDIVLDKYKLSKEKYFMLSAGCRWTKNNAIAIYALDKLFSNSKYSELLDGFKVILLGTDDLYKKYFEKNVVNKERFIFEDFVDNLTLEKLYKNAHMFIFPSVLEGFGQPPTEAMKYGTLSACSTSMSIPEVCSGAVIYFDPYDMNSIALAILKSFDREYADSIRRNAVERFEELQTRRKKDLQNLVSEIMNYRG